MSAPANGDGGVRQRRPQPAVLDGGYELVPSEDPRSKCVPMRDVLEKTQTVRLGVLPVIGYVVAISLFVFVGGACVFAPPLATAEAVCRTRCTACACSGTRRT